MDSDSCTVLIVSFPLQYSRRVRTVSSKDFGTSQLDTFDASLSLVVAQAFLEIVDSHCYPQCTRKSTHLSDLVYS